MKSKPLLLVSSAHDARENIKTFNQSVQAGHERVIRLIPHVQAWYAIEGPGGKYSFGPSKYIGYADMNPDLYALEATATGRLDGRTTEKRLAPWASEVTEADPRYSELSAALAKFCALHEKFPNKRARISLFARELPEGVPSEGERVKALHVLIASLSEGAKRDLRRLAFG